MSGEQASRGPEQVESRIGRPTRWRMTTETISILGVGAGLAALMLTGYTSLRADLRALHGELIDTRGEMHEQVQGVRSEMHDLAQSLRTEMRDLAGSLRTEMADLAGSLRTEMADLAGSLRIEMADLAGSLRIEMADLAGSLRIEMDGIRREVAALREDVGQLKADTARLQEVTSRLAEKLPREQPRRQEKRTSVPAAVREGGNGGSPVGEGSISAGGHLAVPGRPPAHPGPVAA